MEKFVELCCWAVIYNQSRLHHAVSREERCPKCRVSENET
jgi:hypothetical protein